MRAVFGLVELDAGELLWDGCPLGLKSASASGTCRRSAVYPRMQESAQLEYFARLHGLIAVPLL